MRFSLLAVTLGATLLLPTGAVKRGEAAPAAPAATPAEMTLVRLLNTERTKRGMRPLAWEPTLAQAGRLHCREMADLDYFDHESPVPGRKTPADRWERVVEQPPVSYTIAENLFYGSQPDVKWGHAELMGSKDHRANILNSTFSKVGVGVFVGPDGEMWVTEMFLS